MQIFEAAGGDLLHVHVGAAGLKHTEVHTLAWASVCWAGWAAVNSKQETGEQRAGGSPVPLSVLCPSSEPPHTQALQTHLVPGHVCNYVLSGQHNSWPLVVPQQISACGRDGGWGEGKAAKMASGWVLGHQGFSPQIMGRGLPLKFSGPGSGRAELSAEN